MSYVSGRLERAGRQLAARCGARVRRGKPDPDQEEELDIVGDLAGWACMGVSRVKDGVVARLVVQVPSDMTRLLKSCLVPIEEELGTEVFQGDTVQRSCYIDLHSTVLVVQSSYCNQGMGVHQPWGDFAQVAFMARQILLRLHMQRQRRPMLLQ